MQNCRLFFVVVYAAVFFMEAFSLNCYSCETRDQGHCKVGEKSQEKCESGSCVQLKMELTFYDKSGTLDQCVGYKGCGPACQNSAAECCHNVSDFMDVNLNYEGRIDKFLEKFFDDKFNFLRIRSISGEICYCNTDLCNNSTRGSGGKCGQHGDVITWRNGDEDYTTGRGSSDHKFKNDFLKKIYPNVFFYTSMFFLFS